MVVKLHFESWQHSFRKFVIRGKLGEPDNKTLTKMFSFRVPKLTYRRILILAFTLPCFVRLIPEIYFSVPVGFDTAILIYGAKYNPEPQLRFRLLESFILPQIHNKLGIDLLFFMKLYSPSIYGLMIVLMVLYAYRVLKWDERKLILLTIILAFSPTMLRMSWDNHSQNLATIFLLTAFNILGKIPSLFRVLVVVPLAALIALTHQLVSTIFVVILISEVIHSLKRRLGSIQILTAAIFAGIITMLLNPVLTPMHILERIQLLFEQSANNIDHFPLALQAFVSTWFLFPACLMGFMTHLRLFSWFMACIIIYVFSFFTVDPGMLIPGRWVVYSTIPLAFFVVNSYRNYLGGRRAKNIVFTITLMFTLTTGVGMLFPSGTPITSLMHNIYPEFPKTLASSTAKQEHIYALQTFINYLNRVDADACIITHYPYFFWWSGYLYNGKTIYIGPEYTTEQLLHIHAQSALESCNEMIYLIWFSGLSWAKELHSIGELSLYKYR